jgi:hypothetical protein
MSVKFDGLAASFANDQRHQTACRFRREQAARVFKADAINIELGGFPRALDKIIISMFGRHRINDVENRFESDFVSAVHRLFPVLGSVGWIRRTHFRNAVGKEPLEPQVGDCRRGNLKRKHRAAADGA